MTSQIDAMLKAVRDYLATADATAAARDGQAKARPAAMQAILSAFLADGADAVKDAMAKLGDGGKAARPLVSETIGKGGYATFLKAGNVLPLTVTKAHPAYRIVSAGPDGATVDRMVSSLTFADLPALARGEFSAPLSALAPMVRAEQARLTEQDAAATVEITEAYQAFAVAYLNPEMGQDAVYLASAIKRAETEGKAKAADPVVSLANGDFSPAQIVAMGRAKLDEARREANERNKMQDQADKRLAMLAYLKTADDDVLADVAALIAERRAETARAKLAEKAAETAKPARNRARKVA